MKKVLPFILLFGFLCGCISLTIPKMNPNPNVNLPSNDKKMSLSLDIDQSIKSSFAVTHRPPGMVPVQMEMWRESLETGFKNGFKDYFKIETSKSASDFTITLLRADYDIVTTAVDQRGNTVAGTAQITYKATLNKKTGEVIKRSAKTVQAKKSGGWDLSIGESAVETMYEEIAKDFFQ